VDSIAFTTVRPIGFKGSPAKYNATTVAPGQNHPAANANIFTPGANGSRRRSLFDIRQKMHREYRERPFRSAPVRSGVQKAPQLLNRRGGMAFKILPAISTLKNLYKGTVYGHKGLEVALGVYYSYKGVGFATPFCTDSVKKEDRVIV